MRTVKFDFKSIETQEEYSKFTVGNQLDSLVVSEGWIKKESMVVYLCIPL